MVISQRGSFERWPDPYPQRYVVSLYTGSLLAGLSFHSKFRRFGIDLGWSSFPNCFPTPMLVRQLE